MSNDTPLFSRPVRVGDIPNAGRRFSITTTPEERDAVARLLGLPAVADLTAKLEVTPFGRDGLAVGGSIHARVTQTCVVSLDEFESTLDAPVDIRFSTDGVDPNAELDLAELTDPMPRIRRTCSSEARSISAASSPNFLLWPSIPIRASRALNSAEARKIPPLRLSRPSRH